MAIQDCIDEIKRATEEALDDEQVMDLLSELNERVEARKAAGSLDSLENELLNVADEFVADAKTAAKIEQRNRQINILRKRDLLRSAEEADQLFDDPSLALEARLVGINGPLSEGRKSVAAIHQALHGDWVGGMIADLRAAEPNGRLLTLFNSGEMDLDVARALEKLTRKSADGTTNKDAQKIAEIVRRHQQLALARENRAGAWIRPLDGYIVRQTHDPLKLRRSGFEKWRDTILPLLDEAATFRDADNTDTFLREAYNGLVNGEHMKATGQMENDLRLAFKGPGNLAKRISAHRKLHFKGADQWATYNQAFGSGSLRESVVFDLDRAAANTALMERFGTNPRMLFDEVLEDLRRKHRNDPAKVQRLKRRPLQWFMNQVDGTTRISHSPTATQIGSNVRAVQTLAKLGGAMLSAIADVPFKAAELRWQGKPVTEAWSASLTSFLDGLPQQKDKLRVSELIGVALEGQIGDLMSRFSTDDSLSGKSARLMRLFFKLNLLGPWTNANKRGIALMMSRDLAMQSGIAFDGLPQRTREILALYGIDETRWSVARQAVRTEADGRDYLMADAIRDLPDEATGLEGRAARQMKDEVSEAIRSYYLDRTDFAVLTPGDKEQAMLTLGTSPGDAVGEAARFMGQFKSFPVTVITKALGREVYSGGAKTLRDALLKGEGDLLGLAHVIAATTAFGFLAAAAKDISKGRTPRTDMPGAIVAAMLQGGGLGIFGDFMLGETNRFGRSMLDTIAGPTIGTIADLDELRARLMAGEDATASAFRLAISNTPFLNLFYTRTAIDYLVMYQLQEMVNPGYLRRMERRMKREQGQKFLLPPPSRAIPRGGGSQPFEGVR